jgi:ribose-phosphate pyrophosphokinase
MRPNNGAIKLVAGNSNPALADAIAAYLATPLTRAVVRRFADMEIFVEIQENVRGTDVYVARPSRRPDPRILRYTDRQSLRRPDDGA